MKGIYRIKNTAQRSTTLIISTHNQLSSHIGAWDFAEFRTHAEFHSAGAAGE